MQWHTEMDIEISPKKGKKKPQQHVIRLKVASKSMLKYRNQPKVARKTPQQHVKSDQYNDAISEMVAFSLARSSQPAKLATGLV